MANTQTRTADDEAIRIAQRAVDYLGEKALRHLNEVRVALKMPPLTLSTGSAASAIFGALSPETESVFGDVALIPVRPKRQMSEDSKKKVGAATKERWAVAKAAGIDTGGKPPTNEMVELAKKKLKRK